MNLVLTMWVIKNKMKKKGLPVRANSRMKNVEEK